MKKNGLVLLVALAIVFVFASTALAADYSDTENHWANAQIEKWSDAGILQGSDGKFRPSDSITRGEMAIIIDRIMDYQVTAKNSFKDLASAAYYTEPILKANASGVILGDAGQVRPKDYITREEAAVMLGRAFGLEAAATGSTNFADKANIASWASSMVVTMESKGFVGGTDGKFLPKNNISRAEVVKIVDNMVKGFITKAETYNTNVAGTLVVNAPGVVLKGITISGDLVVAAGVGQGEITLDNVKITGNLVVKGGGVQSIIIKGKSDIGKVIVAKVGSQVRVVTEDGAEVETIVVDDGSDDVILKGSFGEVQVSAPGVVVSAVGATITSANIVGEKAKVVLDAASTVNTVTLSGSGTEASGAKGAVIKSLVVASTATGAQVTGEMTVQAAQVKADKVAINTVGTTVTVAAGVSGTTSNGSTVSAGTTTTTTTAPTTNTGGSTTATTVSSVILYINGTTEVPATIANGTATFDLRARAGSDKITGIKILTNQAATYTVGTDSISTNTANPVPMSTFLSFAGFGNFDVTLGQIRVLGKTFTVKGDISGSSTKLTVVFSVKDDGYYTYDMTGNTLTASLVSGQGATPIATALGVCDPFSHLVSNLSDKTNTTKYTLTAQKGGVAGGIEVEIGDYTYSQLSAMDLAYVLNKLNTNHYANMTTLSNLTGLTLTLSNGTKTLTLVFED